jgi:hypothetical protein
VAQAQRDIGGDANGRKAFPLPFAAPFWAGRFTCSTDSLSEMAAIPGVLGFELERDRRAT